MLIAVHAYSLYPISFLPIHIITNGIGRACVPFFLCCTGFFMADKNLKDKKIIISFTKKYLKIYGRLTLVYLPFMVVDIFYRGLFSPRGILQSIHEWITLGTYLHLWYLPASIIAIWVLHIFLKGFSINSILIISVLFFIIGCLLEGYRGITAAESSPLRFFILLYEMIFITPRGGVFLGFPFLFVGYYMKVVQFKILKSVNILLFIAFGIILSIEITLLGHFNIASDYNLILSIYPFVFFGFSLLIQNAHKTGSKPCLIKAPNIIKNINYSDLSRFIYFYHIFILGIIVAICKILSGSFIDNPTVQIFLVAVIIHIVYYIKIKL